MFRRRQLDATAWWAILAVGFSALGLPSAVELIRSSARAHDYLVAMLLAVLTIGVLACILSQRPRRAPTPPRPTEVFRAFGELSGLQIWERPLTIRTIVERIAGGGVIVVVGPSGAGKTVSLNELLPQEPALANRVDYYAEVLSWPSAARARDRVVILDQFEHALIPLRWTEPDERDELVRIRDQVASLSTAAHAVILGVREDWYVKLTFMRELLPPMSELVVLSDVSRDADRDLRGAFSDRLRRVAPELSVPQLPPTVTPMALQAAGQLVELARLADTTSEPAFTAVPSPDGAIDTLVARIVRQADYPRTALKTLHALGSARQENRTLTKPDLLAITNDPQSAVDKSLKYLTEQGLIRFRSPNFELTHDALSHGIERLTASELDPAERDNIRVTSSDPSSVVRINPRRPILQWIAGSTILAVVIARSVVRDDMLWYHFSALKGVPHRTLLDPVYFAVAIPYLAWAFYLLRYQITIYRFTDRGTRQRAATWSCNAVMIIGVILAAFAVEWWVVAIAAGGLVQALKSLSYAGDASRPAAVRRIWLGGGLRTLGNMVFVVMLGVVFGLYVPRLHHPAGVLRAFYFSSVPLTYGALYVYLDHLAPTVSARFRGLLSRFAPAP